MDKFFTGVGSRETPKELSPLYKEICTFLVQNNYTLRSGGAPGSDLMFENEYVNGNKEIYLPWKGFNKNESKLFGVCEAAKIMARKVHPLKDRLSGAALLFHSRNCYQVLGNDLNSPSKFLICWTKNGDVIGGTATAIKIAKANNIPVLNLGKSSSPTYEQFLNFYEFNVDET